MKDIRKRICAVSVFISVIIFVLLGYYLKKAGISKPYGWASFAFLLIPLMPFLLGIKKIRITYPLLVVIIYLILGFTIQGWHPWWVLFLTIPIFYTFFPDNEKKHFEHGKKHYENEDDSIDVE